ncbi:MFS transporter [Tumebacillus avium]|uniref:MFS transporter n=2 Tax=Tumebacillus avium TaxID=1903704 RepID=A0A1Y0IRR8_9BACL|nr:MFS transporter [Tumebacillus avium]
MEMLGKIFSRFHPVAWGVIIGTFFARAGFYMTMPYLAIYLHEVKGLSPELIGTILATSFLVGTLASFFGGTLSDRVGRFPVMVVSMLGWAGVFALFSLADAVWAFLVLSALSGLGRNVFEPTARALLTDITPCEQQLSVFNARYFAINLGAALGPLAGVMLGSAHSTLPLLITAGIYAVYGVGVAVLWKVYGEPKRQGSGERVSFAETVRVVFQDKVFGLILLGNLFVYSAYAHIETTLAQYLGSAPGFVDGVQIYTYLLLTNTISVVLLQYPVIHFTKKWSALRALTTGGVLFAAGLWGFGLFDHLFLLILAMIVMTIGEILCFIIGDVIIGQLAPENLRGAYFGAGGFPFLGQSAGPWAGGLLLGWLGFGQGPLVFGILMLLTLLAVPCFVGAQRRYRQEF